MTEASEPPVPPEPAPLDLDHPTPQQRRSLRFRVFRVLVIVLATMGGAIVGFVTTLAIVVLGAQMGRFIFALEDLMAIRWEILPIPIGAIVALYLSRRHPGKMAWVTVVGFGAMLVGIVVGAAIGTAVFVTDVGPWAGGVIGGAAGLGAGGLIALRIRHTPKQPVVAVGAVTIAFLAIASFAAFGATNFLHVDPFEMPAGGSIPLPEPRNVDAVVFLMGDGGAAEQGSSPLLDAMRTDIERWSGALRRDSAVSVIYLGDIVYPQGVHDRADPMFVQDSTRLWSQVDIVGGPESRVHATVGLFLTGNHDWGNAVGDEGIDRVKNLQEQLLAARETGRYVALIPNAGDPGPIVRDLRQNVRIVFIDTHWFLQERSPAMHEQFFARLENAVNGAGDREVIIVAHHPYFSAGPHGAIIPGYHSGGLEYVLKRSGALVQDLNSPAYADLLGRLRLTFQGSRKPPLVYAGGHDHSLQVMTGAAPYDPRFVLVSGAGSKVSAVTKGPGLVWGGEQPGYMMLVFRKDDGVDLFVVGGDRTYLACVGTPEDVTKCRTEGINAFEIVYSASLLGPSKQPRVLTPAIPDSLLLPDSLAPGTPWWTEEAVVRGAMADAAGKEEVRPAPVAVSTRMLLASTDSVSAASGREYNVGFIQRALAGDMHRELWSSPVKLPVLDLTATGGGLTPVELTGGKQTVGVRLAGQDGLEYKFRPVVKNPAAVLPEFLRESVVYDALEDQMAAQLPYAGIVVGQLLDAAGILVPQPVAVVMPNDERLGKFRTMFAGRVGMIGIDPVGSANRGGGFGGYADVLDDDEIDAALRKDPAATVDARYLLRIRLIDLLVGDWDRHPGQWQWGRTQQKGRTVWRAIPEDRDWAFSRIDGLVGIATRALVPRYVGFSDHFPPARRLAQSGNPLDRRWLVGLNRGEFVGAARTVQRLLTDSVIGAAVGALPPSFATREREWLVNALVSRRDQLVEYSSEFYDHVMRSVEVHTFDSTADTVRFERLSSQRVRMTLRAGNDSGPASFDRIIDPRETRRVAIYLTGANDHVVGNRELPFAVTLFSVDSAGKRSPATRK